jgi:hypothetical protein
VTEKSCTSKSSHKFIYYISTNSITIKDNLKRGLACFPHPISHRLRIRDINLHIQTQQTKYPRLLRVGLQTMRTATRIKNRLKLFRNKSEQDFIITEVNINETNIDPMWNEVKEYHDFIAVKDHKYLRWRYGNPKICDSKTYIAINNNEILGFIITELKSVEYPQAYINELIVKPGRSRVAEALLEKACTFYDDHDVNAINYRVVKGNPLEELSTRQGFIYTSYISNIQLFYEQFCDEPKKQIL